MELEQITKVFSFVQFKTCPSVTANITNETGFNITEKLDNSAVFQPHLKSLTPQLSKSCIPIPLLTCIIIFVDVALLMPFFSLIRTVSRTVFSWS